MIKSIQNSLLPICLLLSWTTGTAQKTPLSLEECYALARENYPLIRKLDLINQSSNYSLENASKLFLPQFNVTGQATYQSQTVSFSDAFGGAGLPGGFSIPNISKDQYKIQAEVSQMIYDGGSVRNQRAYITANQAVQHQSIEVSLYALNDRINQIFFSVLLIDEQLKQNEIRKSDIQGSADKIAAALKYGTAFRSNLDELKAELVSADITAIEFRASKLAYLTMLGTLVDKDLNDSTILATPATMNVQLTEIGRPEMKWYDLQKGLLDVEEKKLQSDYMPKLSAFVQGAYGRPTLNFISNKFGAWYVAGTRLNWNLNSLYTLKNNRRNLDVSRKNIDADKETFLLNTQLSLQQNDGDISKFNQLIEQDAKAIALRSSVKKSAQAQLENGVLTTHDYISQVNAENQAKQTLILHRIQRLQAQHKYKFNSGN